MRKYEVIEVMLDEVQRHPKHQEIFDDPEDKDLEKLQDSVKNGLDNPICIVEERSEDGKSLLLVFDGYSRVIVARNLGMKTIWAHKYPFASDAELVLKMTELQTNYHTASAEQFRMIEAVWPNFSKGKGFRSDLKDDDEKEEPMTPAEKKRKPDVYELIGKHLKMKGSKVKHLRKIGLLNRLYFDRIDNGRFSLFAAYTQCVMEERKKKVEMPTVEKPVFVSAVTTPPESFAHNTATDTQPKQPHHHEVNVVDNMQSTEATSHSPIDNHTIVVTCPNCGEEFEWVIDC